ncbi:hypothetical protein D3C72_1736000 [compost metagenome]
MGAQPPPVRNAATEEHWRAQKQSCRGKLAPAGGQLFQVLRKAPEPHPTFLVVGMPVVHPLDSWQHMTQYYFAHFTRATEGSEKCSGRAPQVMRRPVRHRQPFPLPIWRSFAVRLVVVDTGLN